MTRYRVADELKAHESTVRDGGGTHSLVEVNVERQPTEYTRVIT